MFKYYITTPIYYINDVPHPTSLHPSQKLRMAGKLRGIAGIGGEK